MKKVLDDVEKAIDACTFEKIPKPPPGADAYQGMSSGWHILVIRFPAPRREGYGYDGSASGIAQSDLVLADPRPNIVHLTPELAEKAFKLAEKGATP